MPNKVSDKEEEDEEKSKKKKKKVREVLISVF